jgi:hypothetical protein
MGYRRIGSERQFKDATGFGRDGFNVLLNDFEEAYTEKNGIRACLKIIFGIEAQLA